MCSTIILPNWNHQIYGENAIFNFLLLKNFYVFLAVFGFVMDMQSKKLLFAFAKNV